MALPASGPITLNAVNVELGLAGTATISLNDAAVRTLFGIASGTISMSDGYGKSSSLGYIEDYFSTTLYDGIDGTQTIVTGVNTQQANALGGYLDGLIWIKQRTVSTDTSNGIYADMRHCLFQQQFGTGVGLSTNRTDGIGPLQMGTADITFNTDGFTIENGWDVNDAGTTYVAWSFRPQQKFFTEAFYYGNNGAKTINHSLGSKPGCIIIKKTTYLSDWFVVSRKADNDYAVFSNNGTGLNQTAAANSSITGSAFTATTIDITALNNGSNNINASGEGYIVYLFAHNAGGFGLTGTDNVISCGSYTGNGSFTGTVVNLGFEPQWLMIKRTNDIADWFMLDNMRGVPTAATAGTGYDARLSANDAAAENLGVDLVSFTSTGFQLANDTSSVNSNGSTYIYIAIRRGPMKVPTVATSVFGLAARNGGSGTQKFIPGNNSVSFKIDHLWSFGSNQENGDPVNPRYSVSRLTDTYSLELNRTTSQQFGPSNPIARISGLQVGQPVNTIRIGAAGNINGNLTGTYIDYFFGRAPGFFDVVCYKGNGVDGREINHNLGVAPNLIIVKDRTLASTNWVVWSSSFSGENLKLNLTNQKNNGGAHIFQPVTTTTFYVYNAAGDSVSSGVADRCNVSGSSYVAYLYATCPGVSKVGSFTGTGATQVINCGFTGGARFVMIKAANTTGDWYVWDSVRGIVAGNDPYLTLNTTASQATSTDWVDTAATGFELSNAGGNLANSNGVSYIFLAIA